MSELVDRIKAYLEDAPADGRHSDAAGANAYELLDEAYTALAATPALADDDLVSRLEDHGLFNKAERMALFKEAKDEIIRLRVAATPAVGGLAEATIELNGLLDKYWMGDNSKTNIIAMCAAQQKCKDALPTQPASPLRGSIELAAEMIYYTEL